MVIIIREEKLGGAILYQKPYHHGNLRAALIEAGIEMVNEEGIGACTLRKVAAKCNVSRAAPYAHFKDKEDMLEGMKQYVLEKFVAILKSAVSEYSDPEKLLIAFGKAYIRFFVDNPNYYSFLFNQGNLEFVLSGDSQAAERYGHLANEPNAVFLLMDRLGVSEALHTQNFIALWSVVHGLAGIVTMKGIAFDGDWDVMIEKILSDNLTLLK